MAIFSQIFALKGERSEYHELEYNRMKSRILKLVFFDEFIILLKYSFSRSNSNNKSLFETTSNNLFGHAV